MNNMMKNKKGQVVIYFVFIVVSIVFVMISAFFAPLGVLFNTKMYLAGQDIINQANDSINEIQNETVRNQIQGILQGGLDSTQNNISVNNALYQYGWIFMLIIVALVLFLFTRALVEVGSGGRGLV